MTDFKKHLHTALCAAVAAGNVLREHSQDAYHLKRRSKESLRDIVTEVDKYAEDVAIEKIRAFDDSPVLAEESGASKKIDMNGTYWVIDPLDGTVNFLHNIPLYAVSIAYIESGVPRVGVIYNPALNELYYAAEGLGAYKNHSRISVGTRPREEALCAISFSGASFGNRAAEFETFQKLNDATAGCLRTGSAALNLAYLAEGKFDVSIGQNNRLWDVAAGFVIARLAGAVVDYSLTNPKKHLLHHRASHPHLVDFVDSVLGK